MRRLWLLLVLSACDRVFDLDRISGGSNVTPDAPPECPELVLDPKLDEDGDGVLNEADACPRAANHDAHDEDGDGIADPCDPCPHIVTAGADPDCDEVGAACDPDNEIDHAIEFHGFGSVPQGLQIYGPVMVGTDRLVMNLDTMSGANAMLPMQVSVATRYETTFNAAGFDRLKYQYVGLRFIDANNVLYEAIAKANTAGFAFSFDRANTQLVGAAINLPVTARLTIRVTLTPNSFAAELSGDASANVERTLATPIAEPIRYGVVAYRDDPGPLRVEFEHLLRIRTR